MKTLFCSLLLMVSVAAGAATADSGYGKDSLGVHGHDVDRWGLKTNVFEWLVTIPNIGVEMDLTKSEFNKFTVGLTAKYNWNTYHNIKPTAVFNIMDIRPEFRYYYRTKKPVPGVQHHWYDFGRHLRERKHPHPWVAQYLGLYGNYGRYSLKLSKNGYQGSVAGFGATAGFVLPLYEYRQGFIDIEFGAALGLQWATKDKYIHNREANCYSVIQSRKDFKITPFPVLSELRVALILRTKSIKDKVKDDKEKARVKAYYEKIQGDYSQPILDLTKANYDEMLVNTKSDRERSRIMVTDTLYNKGYLELMERTLAEQLGNIDTAFPDEMKNNERADLRALVSEMETELRDKAQEAKEITLKAFMKESKVYFREVKKNRKAEDKLRKAEEKAMKAEAKKNAPKGAKAPDDVKEDKAAKQKKDEKPKEKAEKQKKAEQPAKDKSPEKDKAKKSDKKKVKE